MNWHMILNALARGLAAIGRMLLRGALALFSLLWEVFEEMLRGLGRGVADVLRRAAPWLVGGVAMWGLLVYAPELFTSLLALGIAILGLRIMIRGLFPRRRQGGRGR